MGGTHIPYSTIAQDLANIGTLVVASCFDPNRSGHIAVLRPSTKSNGKILAHGPQICPSGLSNLNDTDAQTGFSHHPNAFATNRIRYYCHTVPNPIVPVNPSLGGCCASDGVLSWLAPSIAGRQYLLQCSSSLAARDDLGTFTNPVDSTNFWCVAPVNDATALGLPKRFYRLLAR